MIVETIQTSSQDSMKQLVDKLLNDLRKFRSNRAHPALVESIKVTHYNTQMPLMQLANISNEDARTLLVNVWDQTAFTAIEKALSTANLGVSIHTAGNTLRLVLPPLTEERRKELIRLLHEKGEQVCVVIRHVRRDANQNIKQNLKEKSITEDDERRAQTEIQKLTDRYIDQIHQIIAEKEKEFMQI